MMLLSCKEATKRWSEGRLENGSWSDRLSAYLHFGFCWVCRRYIGQIKTLGKGFQVAAKNNLDAHDVSQFKKRLTEHLTKAL